MLVAASAGLASVPTRWKRYPYNYFPTPHSESLCAPVCFQAVLDVETLSGDRNSSDEEVSWCALCYHYSLHTHLPKIGWL